MLRRKIQKNNSTHKLLRRFCSLRRRGVLIFKSPELFAKRVCINFQNNEEGC
jgi:hypothetical protein